MLQTNGESNEYRHGEGEYNGLEISYRRVSRKTLVFFKHIIYESQEFPLKQLWYHYAVLFLSPAALISQGVSKPNS